MTNFKIRLQANQNFLSEKEQGLANYLATHQTTVKTMSLQNISDETGVSIATVSRLAKKLGYDNFQELRFSLTQNDAGASKMFEEINETDNVLEMGNKIFASNIDALAATRDLLNQADLESATEILAQAKTIGFFGLGASNIVALDGYHKFLRTERTLSYASDFHMQLMAMTRMKKKDAAIIISHSGTDKSALALAEAGRESGVRLIVITSSLKSPLAQYGDVVFQAVAEEMQFRAEALHALIAQISLMDTLFMLTAIKTEAKDSVVLNKIRKTIQKTRH